MLEKEFNFFKKNQKELIEKYENKFIVIKNDEVVGVYDSELKAYEESQKEHTLGTFLIQQCIPGEGTYQVTYHSRVSIL